MHRGMERHDAQSKRSGHNAFPQLPLFLRRTALGRHIDFSLHDFSAFIHVDARQSPFGWLSFLISSAASFSRSAISPPGGLASPPGSSKSFSPRESISAQRFKKSEGGRSMPRACALRVSRSASSMSFFSSGRALAPRRSRG